MSSSSASSDDDEELESYDDDDANDDELQLEVYEPISVVEDDGKEDGEEDIAYKVYHSHKELMEITERAEDAQKKRKRKAGGAPRKRKPARAWQPKGDYRLERDGVPILGDPDGMLSDLSERHLVIFKHVPTDPPVRYAKDQKRPLWKGVFKMHPSMGYGDDQYYNPKQNQLKVIYASRDKAGQPKDNLIVGRDGSTLPYWVDDWQWVKDSDRKYKENSRMKKQKERASAAEAALPSVSEHGTLLPLVGWFAAYATNKKKDVHALSPSGVLRKDPAKALLGTAGSDLLAAMQPTSAPAPLLPPKDKEELYEDAAADPNPVAEEKPAKRAKKAVSFAPAAVTLQVVPVKAAAPLPSAPGAKPLRLLKVQFLAQQMQLGEAGVCKDWFSADPDELLTAFVKYVEEQTK